MPITPERLTRLRDFGLSEYAARAYLALLDLGVAEARDVSTLSKVPQAKIYHVLEQLHEKGLAVILPEFPKKYAPVPFPEYLDRLQQEHQREANAIQRDREILADMFRVVGDAEVGNRGFFTVIRGRRNVLAKVAEMVDGARRDILLLATEGFSLRYPSQLATFSSAHARDVAIRALLPLDEATVARLAGFEPIAEIRARDRDANPNSERVAIVLVDGARAFLINFLPDDENVYSGKDIGVFTDHEAMVAAIQSLLEPRWASAPGLDARREDLAKGRVPEFTNVYHNANDAREGLRASLATAEGPILVIDSSAATSTQTARQITDLVPDGIVVRAVLHAPTSDACGTLSALLERSGIEARHLAPRVAARFWCVSERESFVSLLPPEGPSSEDALVVHTTNADVTRSLRDQFGQAWTRALPLEERARELTAFPVVHPRDVGLGRIFEETRDAVLLTDAHGRVVLANPAALALFERTLDETLTRAVDELLPDSLAAFLDAAAGSAQDVARLEGARLDGSPLALQARIVPVESTTGERFAMAILGESPAKRVDLLSERTGPRAR